jgi:hypothetical protein
MSREQSNVSDLLSKVSKMPVLRGSITKVVNFVRYAMTLPDFVAALVSYKPWAWLSNFEGDKLQTFLHGICLLRLA